MYNSLIPGNFPNCNKGERTSNQNNFEFQSNYLRLYPNPASQRLNIQYQLQSSSALLSIIDCQGRKLKSLNLSSNSGYIEFDISWLNAGIYHVSLELENGEKYFTKLIIIH